MISPLLALFCLTALAPALGPNTSLQVKPTPTSTIASASAIASNMFHPVAGPAHSGSTINVIQHFYNHDKATGEAAQGAPDKITAVDVKKNAELAKSPSPPPPPPPTFTPGHVTFILTLALVAFIIAYQYSICLDFEWTLVGLSLGFEFRPESLQSGLAGLRSGPTYSGGRKRWSRARKARGNGQKERAERRGAMDSDVSVSCCRRRLLSSCFILTYCSSPSLQAALSAPAPNTCTTVVKYIEVVPTVVVVDEITAATTTTTTTTAVAASDVAIINKAADAISPPSSLASDVILNTIQVTKVDSAIPHTSTIYNLESVTTIIPPTSLTAAIPVIDTQATYAEVDTEHTTLLSPAVSDNSLDMFNEDTNDENILADTAMFMESTSGVYESDDSLEMERSFRAASSITSILNFGFPSSADSDASISS